MSSQKGYCYDVSRQSTSADVQSNVGACVENEDMEKN